MANTKDSTLDREYVTITADPDSSAGSEGFFTEA